MKVLQLTISSIARTFSIICLLLFLSNSISSQVTSVQGTVRDSVTNQPIEFATVSFEKTSIGELTDDNGRFSIRNSNQNNVIIVTLMGYQTRRIKVPLGEQTQLDIKLKGEGVQLKEIVVKPGKEKYSKKNNPAVELIKKVIDRKYDNLITNQEYYMNEEYEKLLFAFNDYKSGHGLLKSMKYLSKYTDTSLIDKKVILPFSVRETISNVYYRKNPKGTRRVITAYKTEGIDQDINMEAANGVITEVFNDINITDNNISLLMSDFVSPLSSTASVNFYKWYIIDTVTIDRKRYVNLGFVPFNTRDVGFIGNIYVTTDSTYAVKKVSFRVPSKINVNFLDEMYVQQEFKEVTPTLWAPEKITMAMDLSVYSIGKVYVEKERTFKDFIFNLPVDVAFQTASPVVYLSDYNKRDDDFWNSSRSVLKNKDYRMDDMVKELRANKFIDITFKVVDIFSTGYVSTNKDEEKNKVDLGTPLTFFSRNNLEGSRFRLTVSTTKNLHPHLFLYGYGAYGTRDGKFKYYGEATWAFNRKEYHKDEFPRHNLTLGYKYDINALGQRFLQAERDNILMSIWGKNYNNQTYNRMLEISYLHEYYNGFSYGLSGKTYDERPAGTLRFERMDDDGNLIEFNSLRTTEIGANVRLALKEKFYQQRRKRHNLPSDGFVFSLSHVLGLKNVFGGQYNYNRTTLTVDKEFWIAPYGRLGVTLKGEKLWGTAPFPLLLSGNANSSITIQRGSFYMLRALEFINDSQLSWDVNYQLGGWLFNRIPLLRILKWREVVGFRGFWGELSKKNDPERNRNLMVFPDDAYRMGTKPYMEYSIGVQKVFQFFRLDYVRRLNYLNHPGIEKSGFRISFDMSF